MSIIFRLPIQHTCTSSRTNGRPTVVLGKVYVQEIKYAEEYTWSNDLSRILIVILFSELLINCSVDNI